jgi:hypothetical protein
MHMHSVRFQNAKVWIIPVDTTRKELQLCHVSYVDCDTKFHPKTSSLEMTWPCLNITGSSNKAPLKTTFINYRKARHVPVCFP